MRKKTAYYDTPFALQKVNFIRSNYTFVGWNTQPDGSGIMYKDRDSVLNLTSVRKAEAKLYAIWKPDNSIDLLRRNSADLCRLGYSDHIHSGGGDLFKTEKTQRRTNG